MDPQLMQLLMQLLSNSGGGGGGQDFIGGSLQQVMNMVVDPNSAMGRMGKGVIQSDIAPWLRREMFGGDPFALYGGGTWNPMTRMTEVSQQRFQRHMTNQTKGVISDYNQKLLKDMIDRNPERADSSTLNEWMIQAGTALTGASQIGQAFVNNASSFGYISGPGGTANQLRGKQLTGAGRLLTKAFLEDRQAFGNLGGGDLGTLVGFEAERGMLQLPSEKEMASFTKTGATNVQMKRKMQETARAISGIRDILTGPLPEVIKALESTFGGQAINTFGLQGAALRTQQYKQMGLMTGISMGRLGGYAAQSQRISEAIAGHSLGAGQAGLMIGAFMSGGFGQAQGVSNLAGVDLNQFGATMAARVTGAQQSATSLRVSAALNALKNQDASKDVIDKFRADVMGMTGPVTSQALSDLTEGKVGVNAIELGRFSRGARDTASQDSLGTRAAMNQSKIMITDYRKQLLVQMKVYEEGDENLSLRQLAKKYEKDKTKNWSAVSGILNTNFDIIAEQFNHKNDDQLMAAMGKQPQAFANMKMAEFRGEIAQEFAQTSGGLGGLLQDIGAGEPIGKSLTTFTNVIKDEQRRTFLQKALGEGGSYNKILREFLNPKTKKGIPRSKTEMEARRRIVERRTLELGMGFNKDYEELSMGAFETFETDIGKSLTEEMKTEAVQLDLIAEGIGLDTEGKMSLTGVTKTGLSFKELKSDEKILALNKVLMQKIREQGNAKDLKGLGSELGTEVYSSRLRKRASEINTRIRARTEGKEGLFEEEGVLGGYVKEGYVKSVPDLLSELVKTITEFITGITTTGIKINTT